MLDQCDTRLVICSSDAIPVSFSLARCPFWFVTCSPVIDINAEMLDMQSVRNNDRMQPLSEN